MMIVGKRYHHYVNCTEELKNLFQHYADTLREFQIMYACCGQHNQAISLGDDESAVLATHFDHSVPDDAKIGKPDLWGREVDVLIELRRGIPFRILVLKIHH
jgi:hypothetical protein